MDVVVERTALHKAISIIRGAIPAKTQIPILGHVLIEAEGNSLTLTGGDLSRSITARITAEVRTPGKTTTPAEALRALADRVKRDVITMKLDNGILAVSAGRSRSRLATLSPADFPPWSAGSIDNRFALSATHLEFVLRRVDGAISTDSSRPFLNGVCFHISKSNFVVVATDGHRLTRVASPIPDGAAGMPSIVIPTPTIKEMITILAKGSEEDDTVNIGVSKGKIEVTCGGISMISCLIASNFPDYERLLPRDQPNHVIVSRPELADAIARVSAVVDERPTIKVELEPGLMRLSARGSTGESVDEVEVEYSGAPLKCGFNAKYVSGLLSEIESDRIDIAIGEASAPTLWRVIGEDHSVFLLMPMRV